MKLKKEKLYYIRFLDHVMGEDIDAVHCEICGWVVRETNSSYVFTWWNVDSNDKELVEGNREYVTILKSTILSYLPLDVKRSIGPK